MTPFLYYACILIAISAPSNVRAAGTTYYVDNSATGCGGSGCSNSNNGTSKATAWKSAPGMQQGAGCAGATHSYTATAGDQFIFKGGVTWPAACFGITIVIGATQDYWGVDKTWFNGGSWTRPLWDMNYTGIANGIVVKTASGDSGSHTFDNIEIAHQLVTLYNGIFDDQEAFQFFYGSTGTVLENLYIHDWASNSSISIGACASGCIGYDVGAILGSGNIADPSSSQGVRLLNSTISDQNGYFFSGATKEFVPFGGACRDCYEVSGSTFSYMSAACFDVTLCHDNEGSFGDIQPAENFDTLHSQVIEDDAGGISQNWNNYLHDNKSAVIADICPASSFYNNVVARNVPWSGSGANSGLIVDTNCGSGTAGPSNIYNNTFDGSAISGAACVRFIRAGFTIGTVNEYNNIQINCTDSVEATITHYNHSNNHPMNTTEASQYGFVQGNKYSPSGIDPSTAGQGVSPNPSCTGNLLQLCSDTSGAPWFGGSYKSRPSTAWDLGAFQGQGGTTGPPTLSITSPSAGTVSGSVNLQSTCTPQGAATCTSVQYSIDGFSFGTAQTSSPYTLAWNTATAANANHVINGIATDSNGQTGSASHTITVSVSNSIPGCFVSTDNDSGVLSWTANQAFTAQSANFTATVTVTPNTANQDTVVALSQAAMTAYGQGAALLRFNSSGSIDVYKGSTGYTSDNAATYSAGTAYSFTYTINFTGPNAGTYSVAETSPSSIAIATNYAFRTGAPIASLGFINAISDNTTPDTAKVCSFQVGSSTSLTISPSSLNFGNVDSGSNASLSATVTSSGGTTAFSSITVAGTGFTKTADTCSTNTLSNCSFTVKFAPSSTGSFSGTATLVDSATGSPQVVNLTGTGIAAASSATPSPTSINFGNVQLGLAGGATSGPVTMTLTNGPVTFATPAVTYDNPDFSTASITCSGSVSAPSCQITPKFIPSSLSNETATMTIHDDAPTGGSTQTVALVGTGVNFPTPAPALMFVFNTTLPITMTMGKKTVTESYPAVCTCNLVTAQWSCSCQ